jgi:hypothetical protein
MLTLPFSFSGTALARELTADRGAYASLAQALSGEQTLQDWRAYAQASIVPDFDWADRPQVQAPDLFSVAMARNNPRRLTIGNVRVGTSFERSASMLRDFAGSRGNEITPMRLADIAPVGLRQEIFSPGIVAETRFGDIDLGAVFAYQRFASWNFGAFSASEVGLGILTDTGGQAESSFGQGVRIGMSGRFSERLGYRFDYRSKIDMDAFNTYRGVYAQPGEFDQPATVAAQLSYQLTPNTAFSLGMEQIQYSTVEPFLSASLPNRFLALLGDGTSPEFRWRDLNVYTAEWRWQPTGNDSFALRYSTQQQPEPTSIALRRALSDDYTNNNFAVAYARRLTSNLQIGFSASYASAGYFLGYVDPFVRPYDNGEQIEAEFLITALF